MANNKVHIELATAAVRLAAQLRASHFNKILDENIDRYKQIGHNSFMHYSASDIVDILTEIKNKANNNGDVLGS